MKKLLFSLILSFALFLLAGDIQAATYYVDWETGDDTVSNGSQANPWKTPWYADDMIVEGDTVIVLPKDGNQSYATSTFGNCQATLDIKTPNTTWMATTSLTYEVITEHVASTTIWIASGTEMIATTTWYIATSSEIVTEPVLEIPILSQTGDQDYNPYCFCAGIASSSCIFPFPGDNTGGSDTVLIEAEGVTFSGFNVWGSVHVASTADNVLIENCDLSGGNDFEGSPSVLRIGAALDTAELTDFTEGLIVRNNKIHRNRDSFNSYRNYNGLVLINGAKSLVFENNDIYHARYAGVLWRERHNQISFRRNYFHDTPSAIHGDGYIGDNWFDIDSNIFENTEEEAIYINSGELERFYIRNNLFYNSGADISWTKVGDVNVNIFNNIHYHTASSSSYYYDAPSFHSINEQWTPDFYNYLDYNQYYIEDDSVEDGWFINYAYRASSLSEWQDYLTNRGAGNRNSELHSTSTDPGFIMDEEFKGQPEYFLRNEYPTTGRGAGWLSVMGPYVTGNETIGSYIEGEEGEFEEEICGDSVCGYGEDCYICEEDCGICMDAIVPARTTDLEIIMTGYSFLDIIWTASGDDGMEGLAEEFDIRFSGSMITEDNWYQATQVTGEPAPLYPHTNMSYSLVGLFPDAVHYVAIKTKDEANNWSNLSNVVSARTIVQAPGGVVDRVPPMAPTLFLAEAAYSQVRLTWENPTDPDFVRVRMRRSFKNVHGDDVYSQSKIVYDGAGEEFIDVRLAPHVEYTYSIESYDKTPNYSEVLVVSVTPDVGAVFVDGDVVREELTDAEKALTSLANVHSSVVSKISKYEAQIVYLHDSFVTLSLEESNLYDELVDLYTGEISEGDTYSIASFICDGSQTTIRRGAGERAGVLHSYLAAFDRLPSTVDHWQDVIKIANGRWPAERNMAAEERARLVVFEEVYLREADTSDSNDLSAIILITYGLLPVERNMDSEAVAIGIFEDIFERSPSNGPDWNIVRAIAYSGATR